MDSYRGYMVINVEHLWNENHPECWALIWITDVAYPMRDKSNL